MENLEQNLRLEQNDKSKAKNIKSIRTFLNLNQIMFFTILINSCPRTLSNIYKCKEKNET